MLGEKKIKLASDVRYGYLRDENGLLTSYASGDRYVYVEAFDPPIPKQQTVSQFSCIVIHHGKEKPCTACGIAGHRIGEDNCRAKPTQNILAFSTFQHQLSNHFPCNLEVYDSSFRSLEHAYLWRRANEFGKQDLGNQIRSAKHAGVAKRLS